MVLVEETMLQLIQSGAARIAAGIQSAGANIDFQVLALPGGSVIAVLLWLFASTIHTAAITFLRRATGREHSARLLNRARAAQRWLQ